MEHNLADPVRTTRELIDRGWSRGQLQAAVRTGDVSRIRRGAYGAGRSDDTAESAYRKAVIATAKLNPTSTVSHLSAAAMFGLPLVEADLSAVHLTLGRSAGGRRTPAVRRHTAHGTDHPVMISGLRVTSVARTLADVARTESLHTSLPMIDEALQTGLTTTSALHSQARAAAGRDGAARLRRSLELLDSAAESPGESLFRLVIDELGLPTPVSQVNLHDAAGRWIARSDFLLEQYAVVIEFDGLIKYGEVEDGTDARTALIDEKRREDRIRETGLIVVRLIWPDLYAHDRLALRLQRSMVQGRRAIDAGLVTAIVRHDRFPGGSLTFGDVAQHQQ